jgi:hypothetical protein
MRLPLGERYRAEGPAGLRDRPSRPRSSPTETSPNKVPAVLATRAQLRTGPIRIAAVTGVLARTVSRILVRNHVPRLAWYDPLTGALIRASRATANRSARTGA